MLESLNREWVRDSLITIESVFDGLCAAVSGTPLQDPFGNEFLPDADALWEQLLSERERLHVLLNNGQINLIDADWLTRECLDQAYRIVLGGPDSVPDQESGDAKKAVAHWSLGSPLIRRAHEMLESSPSVGQAADAEWSRPMSLSEAARLLGCKDSKRSGYMRALMDDDLIKGRKINRQKWEFRLDTVDSAVRDKFGRVEEN